MRHRVVVMPRAVADIEREYARLSDRVRAGEVYAGYPEAWYDEIEAALYSLEEFPERCPLAPEAERFGRPLRHRILDNRYRIIFEAGHEIVRVLHVRHQRRRPWSPRPR